MRNQSTAEIPSSAGIDHLSLARPKSLWQHRAMIEYCALPDDNPALAASPLLRAGLLTLRYAQENGAIGLTKAMAFKRVFVHWAVEHFDWPGKSAEEMFRYSKVINEYEFPPLEVLHQLLITLRLGRHFNGEFRLTKRGAEFAGAPARLFAELIPFFVLQIDHSSSARFEDRPFGKWDLFVDERDQRRGRPWHHRASTVRSILWRGT
jgi:hypothetical protein